MIYTQKTRGPCADYAMLVACEQLWVDVTEEYMLSTKEIGITTVARTLVRDGKIQWVMGIDTQAWVDFWLRKGHYIVSGTGKMNWSAINHSPYQMDFLGNYGHNFCIVAKLGYMYQAQDSQWPDRYDRGFWYFHEKHLRNLKKFRIIP